MEIWWLLLLLIAAYPLASRRHPGLTNAVVLAACGVLWVGLTVWLLIPALIEGGGGDLIELVLLLVVFWGLPFVLLLLGTGTWYPVAAPDARIEPGMIESWEAAGYSEWMAWRLRPGHPGLVLSIAQPGASFLVFAFHHQGRWQTAAASSLDGGAGILWTAGTAFYLFDPAELRQIISAPDSGVLVDTHQDAMAYAQSSGVTIDQVEVEGAGDLLATARHRSRRALLRLPIGLLGSLFRPVLHVGALRSRPGRHWQLRRFRR